MAPEANHAAHLSRKARVDCQSGRMKGATLGGIKLSLHQQRAASLLSITTNPGQRPLPELKAWPGPDAAYLSIALEGFSDFAQGMIGPTFQHDTPCPLLV